MTSALLRSVRRTDSTGKEHFMFAGSKLYFLLHETLFAAENGLPARGSAPPKSALFYSGGYRHQLRDRIFYEPA